MLGLQMAAQGTGHGLGLQVALAALADKKVPNEEAVALAPTVGWLMFAAVVALAIYFIVQRQAWRKWWLTVEDPRTIGLFRIVFGFFVICNVNDLWEYFYFLFTDEGIFTADIARQVHASAQFEGFGDGMTEDSPFGFFDFGAVIEFLKGPKYSILYFYDSPTAFWIHLAAFEIVAVMFMIGFWTRTTGILTFFLMNSLFFRNHLFWEGTELVYRVLLAYLICAKCGHAYSVDNWRRCRKLRGKGLLSTRDGPGGGAGVAPNDDHPKGLQAIYRAIPAWPRRLMMLQTATIMADTGILKNGSVWARGDAVYYAWNMDHFYRFYPQRLSAIFGTNLLKVSAWYAHWGEALFGIVMIGVVTYWAKSEGIQPLKGLRRGLTYLCFAVISAAVLAIIWVTWPVHFTPPPPPFLIRPGASVGLAAWETGRLFYMPIFTLILAGMWWFWLRLRHKPFQVASIFKVIKLRKTYTLDRLWAARWIFGRRIWIPWAISLMAGIFILMNIGMFQTAMLSLNIIFFTGPEIAKGIRVTGRFLSRPVDAKLGAVRGGLGRVRRSLFGFLGPVCKDDPIPAEDLTLPRHRRDSAMLPNWALVLGLVIVGAGIVVKAVWAPEWWSRIWMGGLVFMAGVGFQRWRASRGKPLSLIDPDTERVRTPWAYGPFGRFVTSGVMIWQICAVAIWLAPEKDSVKPWRNPGRQVVAKWLTVTQTDQGWGMFAPNPPRSNVFLKVLVTDQENDTYDLKSDVYAPERKPIPWIWNDRIRKMNRRIIGGESGPTSWYRKWYARYVCRQWALTHEGETPKKVELVKVWYSIPSPQQTWERGWYVPEDLYERTKAEKIEYTERCERGIMGQLPDWIRRRHGLPELDEKLKYRPWVKHKKRKWERRKEKERMKAEGIEPQKATARAKKTKD